METLESCPACLTYGRAMLPLRDSSLLYITLLTGVDQNNIDPVIYTRCIRVCWECHGLLNRMLKFQKQVLEANTLLHTTIQYMNEHEKITYSLSRLSCDTTIGCDYELEYTGREDAECEGETEAPTRHLAEVKDEGPAGAGASGSESSAEELPIKKLIRRKRKKMHKPKPLRRKRMLGKRVVLKGANRNVKIISVTMSDEDMMKYRAEDRASRQYVESKYKCPMCCKGFFLETALARHNETYHNQDIGPYHCEICDSYFADLEQKLGHHKRHYTMFVCGTCGFTHRYLAPVVRHYDQAHQLGKGYQCEQCGEIFQSHRSRRYHRDAVHRQLYKCPECSRLMSSAQSLKIHSLTHTGMPLVECPTCHKSFRGESSLATHIRQSHGQTCGEDAYCSDCNLQFKTKANYLSHLKRSEKHAAPSQLKFPCPDCGKRFLSESEMRQHNKRYHGETTCQLCHKTLKNLHSLDNHMKNVHEKRVVPKKHICELCGKAFSTRGQLKNHHVTHTGERAHACDVCGATFGHRSTMMTHKKLIHLKQRRNVAAAAPLAGTDESVASFYDLDANLQTGTKIVFELQDQSFR